MAKDQCPNDGKTMLYYETGRCGDEGPALYWCEECDYQVEADDD